MKRMTEAFQITTCKNCGAKKLTHRVCPMCGYYKGKQVLTIKSKSKEKVMDA